MKKNFNQISFLVDENVPQSLIRFLHEENYKVIDVKKSSIVQFSDNELGNLASEKKYIILTFDKDFLKVRNSISSFGCILIDVRIPKRELLVDLLKIILLKFNHILLKKSFFLIATEGEIIVG